MKNKSGFTLIEILIVVSIMAVLGVIFTNVLTQTLRGQNKVRVLNQVKQNGQVVLDKLTQEIRQAEKVICVGDERTDNSDTLVIFKQGVYTRFRFYPKIVTLTDKKNGYIAWDNPIDENLVCEVDQNLLPDFIPIPLGGLGMGDVGDTPTPIPSPTPLPPLSFAKYLTDTDPITGISVDCAGEGDFANRIFKQDIRPGFGDVITIKFKAEAGVSAGQAYEANVAEGGIVFTTTIAVRGGK